MARVLGWLIAFAFGVAVLALWPRLHGAGTDGVALCAFEWLGWVTSGLAAWSVARDWRPSDESAGITALVAARGFDAAALGRAHWIATVASTVRVALGPAVVVLGLSLATARSAGEFGARALLAAAALAYLVGVAGVLGILARASVWLWPRRGRTLLVLLVLGPCLIRPWQADLWNVPSLFSSWLALLGQLGAVAR